MASVESITESLRKAHIDALKYKYDALIEQSRNDKQRSGQEYSELAKQSFADMKQKQRLMPQQLAALGLGSGMEQQLMDALESEYKQQLQELGAEYSQRFEDYDNEAENQRILRDNDIKEYKLRNELSDAKANKSGRSSSGVKQSESQAEAEEIPNDEQPPRVLRTLDEILEYYSNVGKPQAAQERKRNSNAVQFFPNSVE